MDESASFSESLQRLRENTSVEYELWNLTETLLSDLEMCKDENLQLKKQFNDLLKKDNSFSQIHIELQEENSRIKDDNEALKLKLNAQKLQFRSEKSEMEKTFEIKVKNLEEEIRKMKQKLNQKEKEFFEELQMAQATAAYEFEKIEQKLKWQLKESSKQLYESNQINSKLREQLENTHIENMRVRPPDNSILKKLETPKQDTPKKLGEINNNTLRVYEPLQIECCSLFDKNFEKQTPPLFKGKSRSSKKTFTFKPNSPKLSRIPPPIPSSDAATTTQKKRRLHDPDDLSYLVDLVSNDN